jgi:hypothetical protein
MKRKTEECRVYGRAGRRGEANGGEESEMEVEVTRHATASA